MPKAKDERVIPEGKSAYEWCAQRHPKLAIDPGDLMNWVVIHKKPGLSNYYAWLSGARELPPGHLNDYLEARAGGYKTTGTYLNLSDAEESRGKKLTPGRGKS